MAASKKEEFNKTDIEVADIAKALSHPARIKILKILNDLNSCMVGNIVDLLPLSQSTVSPLLAHAGDTIATSVNAPSIKPYGA